MRIYFIIGALFFTAIGYQAGAQQVCGSYDYQQTIFHADPFLRSKINEIEAFIKRELPDGTWTNQQRRQHLPLITIPVVVHILYNRPDENVTDQQVAAQLRILNECFRRLQADTVNTPKRFQDIAADCDIEFKLAITDPGKRTTTGIVRKYTPVTKWEADDKMKFSAEAGDDAWDTRSYLNIWVCNLNRSLGYASFPGGPAEKDGVVLSIGGFKYNETIVHETGHWLGLKHLWGDADCGDDMVGDTPAQRTFTSGCPTGVRVSCNNSPAGDMYMNYMDFTSDACTNLFTEGQKERMRRLFEPGGARATLLTSYALLPPLISGAPVGEEIPKWFYANLYPNPASGEVTIDFSYDVRWIGKMLAISNVQGQSIMQVKVNARVMKFDITNLKPGIYFVTGKKEDGTVIKQKLIKM
jgi:hypothetical protein